MGRREKKRNLKTEVLEKNDGICAICGKEISKDKQTIDHFLPKYHGGTDDYRNLGPLCKTCNKRKGSRIIEMNYLTLETRKQIGEYQREVNTL